MTKQYSEERISESATVDPKEICIRRLFFRWMYTKLRESTDEMKEMDTIRLH